MDGRQRDITSVQRKALLRKAYENDAITFKRVQNLKSFSAELKDKAWNNLTSENVGLFEIQSRKMLYTYEYVL